MEYILTWQITIAIFIIAMVVMWFLSGVVNFSRPIAILAAAGIAAAAKYYWWAVDKNVRDWLRFMGLE
jgi:hypothetical protein